MPYFVGQELLDVANLSYEESQKAKKINKEEYTVPDIDGNTGNLHSIWRDEEIEKWCEAPAVKQVVLVKKRGHGFGPLKGKSLSKSCRQEGKINFSCIADPCCYYPKTDSDSDCSFTTEELLKGLLRQVLDKDKVMKNFSEKGELYKLMLMKENFFTSYIENAERTPDKVLLRIDENTLTYSEFIERTAEIGYGLQKLGIKPNDKIGLILPNSIEWYLFFWASIRIGAQPVPIDPQSGVMELSKLIPATMSKICIAAKQYRNNVILNVLKEIVPEKCTVDRIICFADENELSENEVFLSADKFFADFCTDKCGLYEPEENHIMSLACTSGSTGTPKVLAVPYDGFYVSQVDMGSYLGFTSDDVMMIGMTLYHQGGFGMGLQMTVKGGTVLYQPQFNPITFLETVQKYHITVVQLTSTLAKVLLSTPDFDSYDLSSVKVCYFAGEVLPQDLADIFVKKLNIRVINVIGSSETATMVVWDSDRDSDVDPSDFRDLPFTAVRVINGDLSEVETDETGELCIHTDAIITEYFGNPELSKEKILTNKSGRWFCTGDLVKKLPDGRVRFAGRSKRIIKRGGNLVHAEEVESTLLTYPKVEAIAVTAEDHPVIGQQIVAYIQTVGGEKVTRGELARYFDGKLSAYKLPDKVIIVEEIPKDIGKIQFKYLREKK